MTAPSTCTMKRSFKASATSSNHEDRFHLHNEFNFVFDILGFLSRIKLIEKRILCSASHSRCVAFSTFYFLYHCFMQFPSLRFAKRINEAWAKADISHPAVVHCSAGVGRSGTLIAIDWLTQQLDEEGKVAIYNTVCGLRHSRNYLVQSVVSVCYGVS